MIPVVREKQSNCFHHPSTFVCFDIIPVLPSPPLHSSILAGRAGTFIAGRLWRGELSKLHFAEWHGTGLACFHLRISKGTPGLLPPLALHWGMGMGYGPCTKHGEVASGHSFWRWWDQQKATSAQLTRGIELGTRISVTAGEVEHNTG